MQKEYLARLIEVVQNMVTNWKPDFVAQVYARWMAEHGIHVYEKSIQLNQDIASLRLRDRFLADKIRQLELSLYELKVECEELRVERIGVPGVDIDAKGP